MGSIYLSLFATIAFSRLIAAKRIRSVLAWSIAFAYSAICFIIILYPPFQIPAAIIGLCLCAGLFFEQKKNINTKMLKRNVLALGASIATVLLIAGVFLVDKMDIISSVSNTAYPGERLIQSGGYSKEHFLTSNLAPLFQDKNISEIYDRPGGSTNAVNQSESSNFILIFYFLIPLLLLFSVRAKTWTLRLKLSPMTIALLSATVLFTVWMFLPGFDFIGKATLLSQVPQARLLIGFGILNLLFIILYIRETSSSKKIISPLVSIIISLLIFIFYLLLNFHTMLVFEGFLTFSMAVFLALPIPAAIFFFLRKLYTIALTILLVFTFLSSFQVHPLYRGTEVITESELSKSMRDISGDSKRKWIVEDVRIENFAAANGLRSLSGSYLYPQMNLWKELGQDSDLYNRYSHTVFVIDRDTSKNIRPAITVPQADRVDVAIEACDRFLKQNDVGFIVTSSELQQDPLNPCYKFEKKIRYPEVSYYIYRIID